MNERASVITIFSLCVFQCSRSLLKSPQLSNCCSLLYNPFFYCSRGTIHQIFSLRILRFLVCVCMNTKSGTTRRVRIFSPCCIPFHCFCSTARYAWASRNSRPCSILLRNGRLLDVIRVEQKERTKQHHETNKCIG